ncbi:3'-5' exonuclease [Desulfogranum japonicum]|uniref:3'-5' exonuclease n=1 Tax=Desulfogranum japonicum TaxID=231447 RepID=UPI000411A543|nr:3'-5' exonuclease [Desulfogranum japonicum]
MKTESVIVFDFETTGGSISGGDRPIEIGAVRIEKECIVERFQNIMNPGFPITSFIESLTGISSQAVEEAPDCEVVMEKFARFIGDHPLVAHNASFDIKFLDNEMSYLQQYRQNEFACSMLVARRIYPDALNHKLRSLVEHCGIQTDDVYHRALADAEKTGLLWIAMVNYLKQMYGLQDVPFHLMQKVSKVSRRKLDSLMDTYKQQEKHTALSLFPNN